jgi:integrase/recombinase XerD
VVVGGLLSILVIGPRFAFINSGKALFLANNGKRFVRGKLSDMVS